MQAFAYSSMIVDVSMMLTALLTCKLLFSLIMVFYHSTKNHKQGMEERHRYQNNMFAFILLSTFLFPLEFFFFRQVRELENCFLILSWQESKLVRISPDIP